MNIVILKGNLTRDPEVRQTSGGVSVCSASIAVNEKVKRGDKWEDDVTFINLTIWGARGEAFAKYHKKGSPALVHGKIKVDQWEDKTTKEKRTGVKVVVQEWEFVTKSDGAAAGPSASSDGVWGSEEVPF